jgi:hypothetical protein
MFYVKTAGIFLQRVIKVTNLKTATANPELPSPFALSLTDLYI